MKLLSKGPATLVGCAVLLITSSVVKADGLTDAAAGINNSLVSVMSIVKSICLVLAGGTAAWGLVQVLGKATSEDRQSHSHFVRWFVAAGAFGLAWTALGLIFKV